MKMLRPRLTCPDLSIARVPANEVNPFYSTPEYRAWRELVIGRALGRCQWPRCGRKERRMFADHIVELRDKGAPLDPTNGQCLCGKHHTIKTLRARATRLRGWGV